MIVIGAALGIGRLAASALEGMARQPEVSGDLRTTMIIAASSDRGFHVFRPRRYLHAGNSEAVSAY